MLSLHLLICNVTLPLVPPDSFGAGPSASVAPLSTIRPALKDLVCYAVPRIAAVWYDVGLQLDLEPDVLDEIEKERSDQPRRMFAKWLQGSSCSWQSVLDAVEKTRGAKPMEDIRAAVVESFKGAESAGQHARLSLVSYAMSVVLVTVMRLQHMPFILKSTSFMIISLLFVLQRGL